VITCTPTSFRAGDPWTVVNFNGVTRSGQKGFGGMSSGGSTFEHSNPHFYYVAADGQSHYTSVIGVPYMNEMTPSILTREDFVRMIAQLGTPSHPATIVERMVSALLLFVVWLYDVITSADAGAPGMLWAAVLLAIYMVHCVRSCLSGGRCSCCLCCTTCLNMLAASIVLLTLLSAAINYAVPHTSYFVNADDARLLLARDSANAPFVSIGACLTILATLSAAALACWPPATSRCCCAEDQGMALFTAKSSSHHKALPLQ